jgi:malate dehydrogenase (oxaloacetate-decarboxylating)(NADP+)
VRKRYLPSSRLSGEANVLVMPNIDAANILFNVLKIVGGHGVTVGPILLGAARPLTSSRPRRRCAASST